MAATPITHRPVKSWHKIIILVDPRLTDAVAAYLTDMTGTGLEISSPANGQHITPLTFPPEKITAYIPTGPNESDKKTAAEKIDALKQFLAGVTQNFPDCTEPTLRTEIIMEEDWSEKWKRFFTALQITPGLTIKPSWEDTKSLEQDGLAAKAVIVLDPGLAFGTGHHASTKLALLLLEQLFLDLQQKRPCQVLDVGTGSGILAMACALFGAKKVLAIDNDPDAVATAAHNIMLNHLEDKVTVSGQDVTSIQGHFDLIVANITHDILADLVKTLCCLLQPRSHLVLSGILTGKQEHSIREIYKNQGFAAVKCLTQDEWSALHFQKK